MLAGLGLSAGAVVWAAAAAVGLGLLSQLAWLQDVLRWVGGAYLVYLGIQKLCRTEQGPVSLHATTRWQAFRAGVLLNLANPYCLLFFAGTFAAMLPMDLPYWFRAAAVAIILVDALLAARNLRIGAAWCMARPPLAAGSTAKQLHVFRKIMPQPDLVIFDFDGVIVDSEIIAARVEAELI